MKKAYSYLRISSDQQKHGDGIRRQMEASKTYAEQNGYELVETISDIGLSAFSGANITEGGLGRFLAAIQMGKIEPGSVLIVESLDRLSRDKVLAAFSQFTTIIQRGITIITLMDGQVYTQESVTQNVGQLFMSLGIMLRANDESATKSKRLKSSWETRRKNAETKPVTGNCPHWLTYDKATQTFKVDEQSAKTIQLIFDLAINGMGMASIVQTLNEKKIPVLGRASAWYVSYIHLVLRGRAVLGEYQPKLYLNKKKQDAGDPIPNYYPAVISEETWHLAQAKIQKRAREGVVGRRGKTNSNLFTGIVRCGYCGGNHSMFGTKAKDQNRSQFLRCVNAVTKNGCDATAIWNYDEFEDAFFRFVREVKFSELMGKGTDQRENIINQLAVLSSKKTELEARYNSILDRIEDATLSDQMRATFATRALTVEADMKKLADEETQLQNDLALEQSTNHDTTQQSFLQLYSEVQATDDTEKLRQLRFAMAEIIRRYVAEIQVFNKHSINPWEADDISERLRNEIISSGHEDIEKFLGTQGGKRLYARAERYLIIKFHSGEVRVVQPFFGLTFKSVSEKMAKMKKGAV